MDLLYTIAAISNPVERLQCLQTTVSIELHRTLHQGATAELSLRSTIQLARESFLEAQDHLPTAEAAFLIRNGFDLLIRQLTLLVFLKLGFRDAVEAGSDRFVFSTQRQADSLESRLLEDYFSLLTASTDWMMNRFERFSFAHALAGAETRFQDEFESTRAALSQWLSSPLANWEGKMVERLADDLRRLRMIVQFSHNAQTPEEQKTLQREMSPTHPVTDLFLLPIASGAQQPLVGGISCCRTTFCIWWADVWSEVKAAFELARSEPYNDGKPLEEFFEKYAHQLNLDLDHLLPLESEQEPPKTIRYVDLTGSDFPIPWISEDKHVWLEGRGITPEECLPGEPSIAFWGDFRFSETDPVEVDDNQRQIRIDGEPEVVFEYPDSPRGTSTLRFGDRPLPYSAYERWLLEDLCQQHALAFCRRFGSGASRDEFLATKWSNFSVLHVSTHGLGNDRVPECCCLRLSGKDRVFFADILAIDWSNLDLVLLNACMSNVGKRNRGESSLSIAWAFLAGGANAVIATRWPVPDDVAFLFSKFFYDKWLRDEKMSIQEAFSQAISDLRALCCDRPHAWGTYVLLT